MAIEKEDLSISIEEKESNLLPEQVLEIVNCIKSHREQADLFTADLDLLRKRFDVEKSLFGRVAVGYTALSWWVKVLMALVIAGIAAMIGLVITVSWAIILPIVALLLYSFLAYIFNDYTTSDENRFSQMSEGLVHREEEMKQAISELQTAENQLFELIGKLKEFEQFNVEVIDKYTAQVELLAEKVRRYEEAVLQFEELKATFSAHTENLQSIESEFSTDFRHVTANLSQQFERMKRSTNDVEQATQQLQDDILELKTVSLSLTAKDSTCIGNRFEKLIDGVFEQTEEERQHDQERFAQEDAFLAESDTFIVEMRAFLNQRNQDCYVVDHNQEKSNGIRLN